MIRHYSLSIQVPFFLSEERDLCAKIRSGMSLMLFAVRIGRYFRYVARICA